MTCEKSLVAGIVTAFEGGILGVRAEAIAVAMTLASREDSCLESAAAIAAERSFAMEEVAVRPAGLSANGAEGT